MASPDSQATQAHPESSSSPQLNHDEMHTASSFLPHDARHRCSLGLDLVGETLALTESSPQASSSATFRPNVMPLSHADPDVANTRTGGSLESSITSSPIVSLVNFSATCAKCVSTDARTLQIPSGVDAEVPTHSLEFEHLSRRLITTYFIYFLCGWGDGVTATVLPYFMKDFNLNTMTSALLFVMSTVGCLLGTILLERVVKFQGRFYPSLDQRTYLPAIPFFHRLFTENVSSTLPCGVGYSPSKARFSSLVLAALLHPLFFILMGTALNYPMVLMAYGIASVARTFWTGSSNFYIASTPKKPLGVSLGWWCIGSFSAPLVCQTLLAKGIPWRRFYLGSLVLSVIALILIIFNFRPTRNEFLKDRKAALEAIQFTAGALSSGTDTMVALQSSQQEKILDVSVSRLDAPSPPNTLRRALSMPYQWAFIVFIFIYGGSETVFSGYIVDYLLAERNFNSNTVGYVSSGFWGGMGIGRILWGYYCTGSVAASHRRGLPILNVSRQPDVHPTQAHYSYMHSSEVRVAFSMTMLIWFVDSTTENALSSAVIGLVYGPIFAGTLGLCNDVLPSEVHMVSMAILSAASSVGSAILPFVAGLIADEDGMRVFCYVTVSQTVAMFSLWILFPASPPVRVSGPA
ncbi:MFS general substrate transporter [Rhizopogon vinicolor AM-OR11-026]|uniref:MFS general substrate transporter n=1 Tax=Rhizopogon vinicolor AM-OR11-026 TaxID=1314800 RepID=A0A1B7N3I5_9AGAM|nr:MFS general substrate transporter [Rhizopogon vinicolor AM-OR11-026]